MVFPNPQIYPHLHAIFVHVPKTAGTAIERALCETPERTVGGHTTAEGFRRKFPEEFATYFKFGFVRHPVARFLSAYRYLRSQPVHRAHNNAMIHECGTFRDWWGRIRRDPGSLNQMVHFLPAHRFLCASDGTPLVDRICRYEAITEEWEGICRHLGLPGRSLPLVNVSPMPGDPAAADPCLDEWISEVYARDFELGAYERSSLDQ